MGSRFSQQRERVARHRPRRMARHSVPAAARCAPAALIFLRSIVKPRGLDRLPQQRLVLAGEAAPGAERVEAVGEAVLVDEGRERADLLEAIGRRHQDAGFGAQPAPIIEAVLGDDAHVGRDQVPQPLKDLLADRNSGVGMAQREIMRADVAVGAVGNADAADVSVAPTASRTAIGAQPLVLRLGVERDDAGAAQVGQFSWTLPLAHGRCAGDFRDWVRDGTAEFVALVVALPTGRYRFAGGTALDAPARSNLSNSQSAFWQSCMCKLPRPIRSRSGAMRVRSSQILRYQSDFHPARVDWAATNPVETLTRAGAAHGEGRPNRLRS